MQMGACGELLSLNHSSSGCSSPAAAPGGSVPVLRWLWWPCLLPGPLLTWVWSTIKLIKQSHNNNTLAPIYLSAYSLLGIVLSAFQTITSNVGE